MRSPEIAESLQELNEIPGIANTARVSGINFAENITHYGHLWTGAQIGTDPVTAITYLAPGLDAWLADLKAAAEARSR